MIYYIVMMCGIISGVSLVFLALRKKLQLLGSIFVSPKLIEEFSYTDKFLFLIMLIFFLIGLFFSIILYM